MVSRVPISEVYNDRAREWAEKYGIVDYKVSNYLMIYNKSYNAIGYQPAYTIQHTVDLRTMTELPTKRLKRLDRKGFINV